jgi:hypothetical protein
MALSPKYQSIFHPNINPKEDYYTKIAEQSRAVPFKQN